jgi:6-phosphogluconolactonase
MATCDKTFVYISNFVEHNIGVYHLNQASGELTETARFDAGGAVMPLASSPDRRFLYAALRNQPYSFVTFAIDSADGSIETLSVVPALENLVYLDVDARGRFILGSSYGGDTVTVNPIGPQGLIQGEPTAILRLGRNAHSVRLDNSNRFAFVTHLGSDMVSQLLFDERTGMLTANRPPFVATGDESGPRHIAVAPGNRFVYINTEFSGEIVCYALDGEDGVLVEQQRISILSDGYPHPSAEESKLAGGNGRKFWAADIRIAANGKFLYASERNGSSISCFSADTMTGRLSRVETFPTERQPRSFAIDPKGRYLIVCGEKSNHVACYAIDSVTGGLRQTCRAAAGKGPNWAEIVNFR